MGCTQTLAGLVNDCSPNVGGIVEVLVANHADVTAKTVTTDVITAITMASTAKFKKYAIRRETGQMTSTLNSTPAQNLHYISTELALQFNRMETAKRVEMTALSLGELVVIVKDANGMYWYLGYDEPVLATAGDGVTGTARGDANAYHLTLTDNAAQYPYAVDPDIISGLL